jgi:hypothetical protein
MVSLKHILVHVKPSFRWLQRHQQRGSDLDPVLSVGTISSDSKTDRRCLVSAADRPTAMQHLVTVSVSIVSCEILATCSSTYSPVRTSQEGHSVSIK